MGKNNRKTQVIQNNKERSANYELLRILAMAMVITLHYLGKGGYLTDFSQEFGFRDYGAWILEGFCIAAVDIYVLISGYFLVDANFRIGKVFTLWGQVLFYSLAVPPLLLAFGLFPAGSINADRAFTWLFPITREHYWFATMYLFLYLLSPFLGRAVRQMEQRQLRNILFILLLLCSVSKSILPVNFAIDTGGYDILWFICLFLTAAYIRLYGLAFLQKKWNGMWLYLGSVAGIFFLSVCYRAVYLKTGKLGDFYGSAYQYNHILCLTAAVGMLCFFGRLKITGEKLGGAIRKIASCTFGIYLLHENEAIRGLWQQWFSGIGFLPGLIAGILVFFAAGIAIDLVRQRLFGMIQG